MMPLELTADQRRRLDALRARFGTGYVVRLRNAADTAARREFDRVLEVNLYRGEAEAAPLTPNLIRSCNEIETDGTDHD